MATIHLNKGHNINLAGTPKKELKSLPCPKKLELIQMILKISNQN